LKQRKIVVRDKKQGWENKMSASYITAAKEMASFLLAREHRGPGDTIDAAAHRIQTRYGVPCAVLMRLRHREVKDMLLSNFMALAVAYHAACARVDRAYEVERSNAVNPKVLRLADFVAGYKGDEKAAG
jgi:hypothetical protein